MNKVLACIDGLANTPAVVDWAAWAALRLQAPLEFLHVLERHPERAGASDYSGAIGPDAQGALLQALSDQDRARSTLARERGRQLLADARAQAARAGVTRLDARLRHGDLVDTLVEVESEAALFVFGEHHQVQERSGKVHTDHHLERAVRALKAPVLVVTAAHFVAPQRIVLAYDGSANARRALNALTHHALRAALPSLPVVLAMAGPDTPQARRQLEQARSTLIQTGLEVSAELRPGEPQQVLPHMVKAQGPALLVMGAYGHSRLRQWVLGSTTSTLLRLIDVPALVLR